MKNCCKCKIDKPLTDFGKRTFKESVGYQSMCRSCNAKWCKDRYDNGNRKQACERSRKKNRQIRKNLIAKHKLDLGCYNCGYKKNPSALDFHHIEEKTENVSTLVQNSVRIKTLRAEMDKCIVLCSNCHRELHNPYPL